MWKRDKWKDHEILHRSYTPTFFFNFEKILFFSSSKKKSDFFEDFSENMKKSIFQWKIIYDFSLKFLTFFIFQKNFKNFPDFFLRARKKYFFRSWEKKLGYSSDAKIYVLFIYDISRTFWAREPYGMHETKNIFPKIEDLKPPKTEPYQFRWWPGKI